jgi:hypothetical protein
LLHLDYNDCDNMTSTFSMMSVRHVAICTERACSNAERGTPVEIHQVERPIEVNSPLSVAFLPSISTNRGMARRHLDRVIFTSSVEVATFGDVSGGGRFR